MVTDLVEQARAWLAEDPDPDTREELRQLLDRVERGAGPPADRGAHPPNEPDPAGGAPTADEGAIADIEPDDQRHAEALAELADRFRGPLQFGTAGLRGQMGAGPNRMNRAVVIRAAAGLAAYLKQQGPGDGLVVVGYDARHKSADFARDTASVLTGAGLRAAVLPGPLPTPVLAFAVRHLGAVAGVAVTASHNPPRDNGYKVYLGRGYGRADSGEGAQVVPPVDAEIAAAINGVQKLGDVPMPEGGWEVLDHRLLDAYLDRAVGVLTQGGPRDARVVYTPLHGVGRDVVTSAFRAAGFPAPTVVSEQGEPDPEFRTVDFPNPEEPGAMDLAFRCASSVGPDVVIANDPDADRCAVAVPDPAAPTGWRLLHGDEVGALLAMHLVSKRATGAFATTIVSSSLLARIAEASGLDYGETLTGFKWLVRVPKLSYAYEEALGYCVDPAGVRDKDGVSAALLIAELVATLKQQARTLTDLLDDIALEYGLHATDQLSVRVGDLALCQEAMSRLRHHPPATLGGLTVLATEDLARGWGKLPPTDGLRYRLASSEGSLPVRSARVVVRPSGTEPKVKCYLEVVVPVPNARSLLSARATAVSVLDAVKADLSAAAGF